MLTEISLHVLDIAENSVKAKAKLVEIEIEIEEAKDLLRVLIRDDGVGMTKEVLQSVTDPFYTSRKTRKVGLGVPFFKAAALQTEGCFSIDSEPGVGTTVIAEFTLGHLDRMPIGDISATIHTLVVYHQDVDFRYRYSFNDKEFVMDTREFKAILGDISFAEHEVSEYIMEFLVENHKETDGGKVY